MFIKHNLKTHGRGKAARLVTEMSSLSRTTRGGQTGLNQICEFKLACMYKWLVKFKKKRNKKKKHRLRKDLMDSAG